MNLNDSLAAMNNAAALLTSTLAGKKDREQNKEIAEENLNYAREANEQNINYLTNFNEQVFAREDNALQRGVKDAQAAGLSPLVATPAGSGGTASAPTVSALHNDYASNRQQSWNQALEAMTMASQQAQVRRTNAETELIQAQARRTEIGTGIDQQAQALAEKNFELMSTKEKNEMIKFYATFESDLTKFRATLYDNKAMRDLQEKMQTVAIQANKDLQTSGHLNDKTMAYINYAYTEILNNAKYSHDKDIQDLSAKLNSMYPSADQKLHFVLSILTGGIFGKFGGNANQVYDTDSLFNQFLSEFLNGVPSSKE